MLIQPINLIFKSCIFFQRKIGKKLFVNQAKVLASFPLKTTEGKEQHLYLIGERVSCDQGRS